MTTDTIPCPPPVDPLDEAMRELETLEADERDRLVLAQVWQRRTGKLPGFYGAALIAWAVCAGSR